MGLLRRKTVKRICLASLNVWHNSTCNLLCQTFQGNKYNLQKQRNSIFLKVTRTLECCFVYNEHALWTTLHLTITGMLNFAQAHSVFCSVYSAHMISQSRRATTYNLFHHFSKYCLIQMSVRDQRKNNINLPVISIYPLGLIPSFV